MVFVLGFELARGAMEFFFEVAGEDFGGVEAVFLGEGVDFGVGFEEFFGGFLEGYFFEEFVDGEAHDGFEETVEVEFGEIGLLDGLLESGWVRGIVIEMVNETLEDLFVVHFFL